MINSREKLIKGLLKKMTDEPIWISTSLNAFFTDTISRAYEHPEMFHDRLAPIPWRAALFGREGVHKAAALTKLCDQHKYNYLTVDVRIGKTMAALTYMECCLTEAQKVNAEDTGPHTIMIVNHADVLCYEPDNESCMLKALELERFADAGVMIVGIFDRIPNDQDPQKTTPWAKECQMQYFRQFQHIGYAACPSSDFRQEYFRWALNAFVVHHAKRTLDLSEGDYVKLADYSTFATCKNIMSFLRNIFYDIIRDPTITTVTLDMLKDMMMTKMGVEHVCDYDTRAVEDRFSLACGKGPIVRPKQLVQPSELPQTNVTSFTPDAANFDDAAEMLRKNKKSRAPKRNRDATEEQESAKKAAE